MREKINFISRVLVGSLFIVSGFIKANDTLGFQYKLEEYFSEEVLNMPYFVDYALIIAVLICLFEIVLGLATIIGYKMKVTTTLLMLMTIFFGFLTFYSAWFDVVKDCGCFGDAMKGSVGRSLTPWETFTKDLILFIFILPLYAFRKKIDLAEGRELINLMIVSLIFTLFFSWVFTWYFSSVVVLIIAVLLLILSDKMKTIKAANINILLTTIFSLGFMLYTILYLPVRDYRPYAIGKSIVEGMKSCTELGEPCPEYANVYNMKNIKTGEEFEMLSTVYLKNKVWEDTNIEIIGSSSENVMVQSGYEAPIHDFVFYKYNENQTDYTDSLLNYPGYVVLLVAYDINKADESVQSKINEIATYTEKNGDLFIGATASSYEDIQAFKFKHQNAFDYLLADGTMLKTIVRSNPGLVVLKNGVVLNKISAKEITNYKELFKNIIR